MSTHLISSFRSWWQWWSAWICPFSWSCSFWFGMSMYLQEFCWIFYNQGPVWIDSFESINWHKYLRDGLIELIKIWLAFTYDWRCVQFMTRVSGQHRHNTDTRDYIQFIHFFHIITSVDVSVLISCPPVHVCQCFLDGKIFRSCFYLISISSSG